MTIRKALEDAVCQLSNAGVPDPAIDAEWMLEHVTGLDRFGLRVYSSKELTAEQEQRFSSLLLSRAKREPVQYLLGEQYFYGLRFQVEPSVLIPRQETEELCEWGLKFLRQLKCPSALDLCTGSGAIAVTLKHECPQAEVTASDLSAAALETAAKNAALHQADIRFLQGDLWEPLRGMQFDLILSNPPYIPSADCDGLQPEVMREPRMALDGGADGLDFYRRIAREAAQHLTPGGMIAVELGVGEAEKVAGLFREAGLVDVEIRKDLYGIARMVGGRRSKDDV